MQVHATPFPGSPPDWHLNHKTKMCRHCKRHRSTNQYTLVTDDFCKQCSLRGYGVNQQPKETT
jgi:hypothetical protein